MIHLRIFKCSAGGSACSKREREREREGERVRDVSIPSNLVAIITITFGHILTYINATDGPASLHKALRCLAQLKTV